MNEVSKAQAEFMKKHRRRGFLVAAVRWALLIALIAVWEIGARIGWIDAFLLSSPSRMLETTLDLYRQGVLFEHIFVTVFETLAGFLLGGVIGFVIAVLLWWFDFARRVLDIYIVVLNSLPKIALGPILIVWMGAGIPAIIAMAVLISVVVTLVTVLNGFLEVSQEKIFLMRSFGATKSQIFSMVVLPSGKPAILSAIKLNIGLSWVGVIVGEYLVSRAGLGYLIVYGGQVFQLDLVMASTVILCICAVAMYFMTAWLERRG